MINELIEQLKKKEKMTLQIKRKKMNNKRNTKNSNAAKQL